MVYSGFLNGGAVKRVPDVASRIKSYIKDLQRIAQEVKSRPTPVVQFITHTGLCWCENMEKEAMLQLNPNTDIRLKLPFLVGKVQIMEQRLYELGLDSLIVNGRYVYNLQVADAYKGFQSNYEMLRQYDLDSEVQHFIKVYVGCGNRQPGNPKFNVTGQNLVRWLANRYTLATTRIEEIPCTCRGEEQDALHQLLPTGANTPEIICYNSCDRTLFAAFKRQMMRVYEPDPQIVEDFQKYTTDYFDKYVEPVLRSFDYSYSQWFNRLPRNKQDAMVQAESEIAEKGYPELCEYGLFCKREKQEAGGKNRAIANIEPAIKYIMGPVCWALEDCADKYFPGYCGKKSWDDLENLFQQYYAEGFTYVLQGDGSAFDTCQHYELKLIDRLIYQYLARNHKIWHVNPEDFERLACSEYRELNAKTFGAGGVRRLGSATIRGTVFSGASDTTLMNTLRMALYNLYTLERLGLKYGVDFKLLAKGDDFIIFSRVPKLNGCDFESLYLRTWRPKPKHMVTNFDDNKGTLGMILKFLNVGDYDTIDFCSVTCIPYANHTKFKLARKPNRMDPLAHYSRATLKLQGKPGLIKQYLLDQAMALEISHGSMPFYREYAKAYRVTAARIKAEPQRSASGRPRLQRDNDGHKYLELHEHFEFAEREFYDYGHEYIEGLKFRFSTHDEVTDDEVYEHLLKHFSISPVDVQYHYDFLVGKLQIYDCIADSQ